MQPWLQTVHNTVVTFFHLLNCLSVYILGHDMPQPKQESGEMSLSIEETK